jgi:hypothetical protein
MGIDGMRFKHKGENQNRNNKKQNRSNMKLDRFQIPDRQDNLTMK